MRIEIELPEIEGFEYTGEYRAPKLGESFLNYQGEIITFLDGSMDEINPILRKLDPPSLEDRIKAEFPDKRVVMLVTRHFLGIAVDIPIDSNLTQTQFMSHTVAQSMRGFHKYIYEVEDGSFVEVVGPVLNCGEGVLQPCAVLFEDDK